MGSDDKKGIYRGDPLLSPGLFQALTTPIYTARKTPFTQILELAVHCHTHVTQPISQRKRRIVEYDKTQPQPEKELNGIFRLVPLPHIQSSDPQEPNTYTLRGLRR